MDQQPPHQWQQPYQPGQPPPYTQYSQSQPGFMPPPQPAPAKKSKAWIWLIVAAVVVLLGMCGILSFCGVINNVAKNTSAVTSDTTTTSSQPGATQAPTKPTKPKAWTITHTFTGNGAKKTASFTVGDDWKIAWTCQGTDGIDAPLFISVAGDVNDFNAGSATCAASGAKTTGETEEHQGGTVYLDINTGIPYTITVQELK